MTTHTKKSGEPNKGGRPPALTPDEATLEIIRGLGEIQCTTRECAAVLGVSHQTFIAFKAKHQEVSDALEAGMQTGRQSLRRKQFKMADTNASMAIWLGKQYLDQTDKQDITANVKQDVTISDARAKLEHQINRVASGIGESVGTSKPH